MRVTDELVCGETQEEHLRNLILRRSDVDDHGSKLSLNFNKSYLHSVLKWQQNLDLPMQCEAINNLSTTQVRKDTPSLIDRMNSPDERRFFNSGRRRRRHSSPGVIKESEMMLEGRWAADGNHDDSD